MNIYLSLFQASITLLGFIAIFLVFRYRQIDTYVDSRKEILISSLLIDEIKTAPYITVIIEDIGKKPQTKDADSFFELINKELDKEKLNNKTKKELDKEKLNKKTKKEAIKKFFDDILEYRRMRDSTVCRGLWSIGIWGVLSLIYLLIHVLSPCLFNNIRCFDILLGIMVCLFIISMIFTLYFVYKSLYAKRPI
jgi:hypothetical protein